MLPHSWWLGSEDKPWNDSDESTRQSRSGRRSLKEQGSPETLASLLPLPNTVQKHLRRA
jgi:hypothetical protein